MGEINRCLNCNCECHCCLKEHSDMLGVCPCAICMCKKDVVVDSSDECETCQ